MAGRKFHPSAIISSSEKSLCGDADTRSAPKSLDPLWAPVPGAAFCEPTAYLESATGDGGEDYEGCGSAKKRRLSPRQVQSLEKSFNAENKLEPERKAQIATELGLQPRQVAVWFQNRRARFKTKQLEKDYGELKDSYDKLKAECDCLSRENEQLKEEVRSLKDKLLMKDQRMEKESPEDKKLDGVIVQDKVPDQKPSLGCKQEEATTSASRSSGVLDYDSPYLTGSSHYGLLLEPANSSHAFGPDCSDFSQEEGDNVLEFPRLGHAAAYRSTSGGFGFTGELEHHLWSWLH